MRKVMPVLGLLAGWARATRKVVWAVQGCGLGGGGWAAAVRDWSGSTGDRLRLVVGGVAVGAARYLPGR